MTLSFLISWSIPNLKTKQFMAFLYFVPPEGYQHLMKISQLCIFQFPRSQGRFFQPPYANKLSEKAYAINRYYFQVNIDMPNIVNQMYHISHTLRQLIGILINGTANKWIISSKNATQRCQMSVFAQKVSKVKQVRSKNVLMRKFVLLNQ